METFKIQTSLAKRSAKNTKCVFFIIILIFPYLRAPCHSDSVLAVKKPFYAQSDFI